MYFTILCTSHTAISRTANFVAFVLSELYKKVKQTSEGLNINDVPKVTKLYVRARIQTQGCLTSMHEPFRHPRGAYGMFQILGYK